MVYLLQGVNERQWYKYIVKRVAGLCLIRYFIENNTWWISDIDRDKFLWHMVAGLVQYTAWSQFDQSGFTWESNYLHLTLECTLTNRLP